MTSTPADFDPDGASVPGDGSGIFGLRCTPEDALVHLTAAPFDATTSFHGGCADAPAAIDEASRQLDLNEPHFGGVWESGIVLHPADPEIGRLQREVAPLARAIVERGAATPDDADDLVRIDEAGERVTERVQARCSELRSAGRLPGLVGGDHSTALGAMLASVAHARELGAPLGVLQIDAHMDLRVGYQGFAHSHASIMANLLDRAPETSLVQVGIRDWSPGEQALARQLGVRTHFDAAWWRALDDGAPRSARCAAIAEELPELVHVRFDIDGLDPSLCPGTGTPVPGGLPLRHAAGLLEAVVESGRRVVGFDLVEVCPVDGDRGWNANVGARVLYLLCGAAVRSNDD